jgi:hypothetical protein
MLGDLSPQALPTSREKILSSTHTQITFTASQKLLENLERIRALWGNQGHLDFPELFQKMAELVLERIDPASKGQSSKGQSCRGSGGESKSPTKLANSSVTSREIKTPQSDNVATELGKAAPALGNELDSEREFGSDDLPPLPPEFDTPSSRHIPEPTKREVWHRDEGRCTHPYANGTRCYSRFALQFDHIVPWAYGGTHKADNLRLLCRAHHALRSMQAAAA